ncbi:MAG: fructose-bisphosphate aldolase class I [Planctomycetes bacterium]|nr:fructose-bisphosphate aldolase class I [Planctomycetota bacterium]
MSTHELKAVAKALVAKGKGILAADESTGTIEKRFQKINLPNTEENRRNYRELLFRTKGAGQYVSGAILYEETLKQKAADGTTMVDLMNREGIVPGIKVDKGAVDLAGAPGEKVTEGLDGLRARCAEYYKLGARFAKWRAVITIGDGIPSAYCLEANAHALARYAKLCQEQGLVPIVEPEVLMDWSNSIEVCYDVTRRTLECTFDALYAQRVSLEEMLLKPNMVIAGKQCPKQASAREVAEETICCFRRSVPAAVPGIVFLSGGQSEAQATENLNEMNKLGPHPWELSFSYGRALQDSALKAWAGQQANLAKGQRAFLHRSKMNGLARSGKYDSAMEKELVGV